MGRDSTLGTLLVALVLCLVCSVLVSSAAVLLRPYQEANKRLDKKKNILYAAALATKETPSDDIESIYGSRIQRVLVNLDEATVVLESEQSYDDYNSRDAALSKEHSQKVETDGPTFGIARREKLAFAYLVVAEGEEIDSDNPKVAQYVVPIYGKGLWSTLYGFIAIDADGKTIRGITFYEHKETPGLGGEVDNADWKAKWGNPELPKYAYDDEGHVAIRVMKGSINPSDDDAKYKIDGLSGATITSRGVTNLVQYWLGDDGFGPYLKKQTAGASN